MSFIGGTFRFLNVEFKKVHVACQGMSDSGVNRRRSFNDFNNRRKTAALLGYSKINHLLIISRKPGPTILFNVFFFMNVKC